MFGFASFSTIIFSHSGNGFVGPVWVDQCPAEDTWNDAAVSVIPNVVCSN